MRRSIVAIAAGLLVTMALVIVLSGVTAALLGLSPASGPTPLYLALNLLGGAIAGVAGGATVVYIARHAMRGHIVALAFVILLLSLPGLFSAPAPGQPGWYPLALSVLGPGSVLLGGFIALRSRG